MKICVSKNYMQALDEETRITHGIPQMVLMERAALAVTDVIEGFHKKGARCLIVCGTGNNGADGVALGRLLKQRGYMVSIALCNNDKNLYTKALLAQLETYESYGYEECQLPVKGDFDFVIDAVFGVGLSREIKGDYYETIKEMNAISATKIAIDIASGIDASTGEVLGIAFRADVTVSFAYAKMGQLLWPGNEYSGKIYVRDIGIYRREEEPLLYPNGAYMLEDENLMNLPLRKGHSNKGSYGKVLIVGGDRGMAGAVILSAKTAFSCGCGMVRVLTHESNRIPLHDTLPDAMYGDFTLIDDEKELNTILKWADVLVIGPGFGTGNESEARLERLLFEVEKTDKLPIVLDADALNILVDRPELLPSSNPTIITPHLGEMSRLLDMEIASLQQQLFPVAYRFAIEKQLVCVLKDFRTIVALPDGQCFFNMSGNSGLSKAGSGDCLTGIIASLIAQGMDYSEAAAYGVYLHGSAAERISQQKGTRGMLSSDLAEECSKLLRIVEKNDKEALICDY